MASSIKMPPPARIPLAAFKNTQARQEFIRRYRENQDLWPVPFEEKRIKTSFGVTSLMISGKESAPPLVLLHGFTNTPLMWRYNIEELSQHYRVYMPETMGDAGVSNYKQIALRSDQWTEWLQELFDTLNLDSFLLGGFSLGGWHAARFAIKFPARVKSLVLLSPVPFFRKVPYHLLREGIATVIAEKRPELRRLIGKQYAAQFYPDKAYELLHYAAITGYLPSLPIFPREMTQQECKLLPDKMLIIVGDEEIYFDPNDARSQAKSYLPAENFILLEETGHSVSIERPDRVNSLLLDFWEENS
jgi:pimeloyl-ACP methyl ester carboxylesterase